MNKSDDLKTVHNKSDADTHKEPSANSKDYQSDLAKALGIEKDTTSIKDVPDEDLTGDIPTVVKLLKEIQSLQNSQRLIEQEELVVAYRPASRAGIDLRPITDSDSVSASSDSAVSELMENLISHRLTIIVDKLEKLGVTVPTELVFTSE